MKVFLGGTCNKSQWREILIPMLEIEYYNPVVEDWTPACQAEEIRQRKECDFVLYVITPRMLGTYSISEVTDDSNKHPEKTIFCILEQEGFQSFNKGELRSLHAVSDLVMKNGAAAFTTLKQVATYINSKKIMAKTYNVTLAKIEAEIVKEEYIKMGTKMTVCLLTLKNGHEVIGTAGVVDASKYDLEIGMPYAREKAVEQLWPLLGYAKQVEMYNDSVNGCDKENG